MNLTLRRQGHELKLNTNTPVWTNKTTRGSGLQEERGRAKVGQSKHLSCGERVDSCTTSVLSGWRSRLSERTAGFQNALEPGPGSGAFVKAHTYVSVGPNLRLRD